MTTCTSQVRPPSMPPPPHRGLGQRGDLGANARSPFHMAPLPASGSPLQFYVDYVNCGHVTAYGPGLTHGVVNKPAVFTVNTKDAGEGEWQPVLTFLCHGCPSACGELGAGETLPSGIPCPVPQPLLACWGSPSSCPGYSSCPHPRFSTGGLSLAIEGPSKAEISCTDNQDGTCSVSYLPVLPGDYSILVKYNEQHIPGSPFTARVTGGCQRGE